MTTKDSADAGGGPTARPQRGAPLWLLLSGSIIAFAPVWNWYVRRLDDGSDEPFGLLPLVTALVLYGAELGSVRSFLQERRSRRELVIPLGAAAGYLGAALSDGPPLLRAIFAVLAIGSLLVPLRMSPRAAHGFERRIGACAVGVWGLLLLSLPVIASLQFFLGYPARLVTAYFASRLLSVTGITPELNGILLEWHGKPLLIDSPCSGVKLLWMMSYLGFTVVTALRLTGRRAWLQLFAGSVLVLYANVIRTTFLFYTEMEIVAAPKWAHTAIGALTATGAAIVLLMLARLNGAREQRARLRAAPHAAVPDVSRRGGGATGLLYLSLLGFSLVLHGGGEGRATSASIRTIDHDTLARVVGAEQLELVPLRPEEEKMARDFPGAVVRARKNDQGSEQELLIRLIYRPTRALHPAADCFRASGYAVQPEHAFRDAAGRVHSCIAVTHGSERLRVCERIESAADGQSFPDVSTWFWNALLGRTEGPWVSVAVVEPLSDEPGLQEKV